MIYAIVLDLLSLLSLAGAYALHYFTVRKIGMLRWVNYYTNHWQRDLPMEAICCSLIILFVLAAILMILSYQKQRENLRSLARIGFFFSLPVVAAFICAALLLSLQKTRAFYFVLLALALAAVFQILKNGITLHTSGKMGTQIRKNG